MCVSVTPQLPTNTPMARRLTGAECWWTWSGDAPLKAGGRADSVEVWAAPGEEEQTSTLSTQVVMTPPAMTTAPLAVSETEASGENAAGTATGRGVGPAPERGADAHVPESERGEPGKTAAAADDGKGTEIGRPAANGVERGAVTESANAGVAAGTARETAIARRALRERRYPQERGPQMEPSGDPTSSLRVSQQPMEMNSDGTETETGTAGAATETATADGTETETTNETETRTESGERTGTWSPKTRPLRRTTAPR